MIRLFIASGGNIRFLQNNKWKKTNVEQTQKIWSRTKNTNNKKTAIYFEMQLWKKNDILLGPEY